MSTPLDQVIVLRLTRYQAYEVSYGLEIDRDDGKPEWGRLTFYGKPDKEFRRPAELTVMAGQEARDNALYRITSSRDIRFDNAATGYGRERLVDMAHGRSLDSLARKLVAECGGPDGFSPEMRRWINY